MADQQFLASFGVDIDESGVSRLQKVLSENRTMADSLAKSFDAASESVRAFKASISEELPTLLSGSRYIEKGWADMDDRSNMENVWLQYHALGGNGDMNDLRRTFRHLPMAKDGAPMIINQEGDENV